MTARRNHLTGDLLVRATRYRSPARGACRHRRSRSPPSTRRREPDPALVAPNASFLLAQVTEHRAKIAALDGQRAQKEAELATISATVDKLEAVIPTIEERVNIRKTLRK